MSGSVIRRPGVPRHTRGGESVGGHEVLLEQEMMEGGSVFVLLLRELLTPHGGRRDFAHSSVGIDKEQGSVPPSGQVAQASPELGSVIGAGILMRRVRHHDRKVDTHGTDTGDQAARASVQHRDSFLGKLEGAPLNVP